MYGTGYYATGYYDPSYYVGKVDPDAPPALFTYETLIGEAREVLGDTTVDCRRFPDATLVNILNRGLNELNRIRPDAWYEYYGQYTDNVPEITDNFITVSEQVNWKADFQPDNRFYPALVYYVAGVANIVEDERIATGTVERFLLQFQTLVLNI
jgi:hypothetical protein